jgi:hypothetical protein
MAFIEYTTKQTLSSTGARKNKKFGIFLCDVCGVTFEKSENLKKTVANPRHYCGHACHRIAMKSGGIADESRKSTCREKYGADYLIAREDVAKKGSLVGNSAHCRKMAAKSFKARLENYSFQLTRGLTITRSKSEVDFLSNLADVLAVELEYQKFKNGWWIDGYCAEHDCWIQFDGVYWHSKPEALARDLAQNDWFRQNGMRLLRITDEEAKMPGALHRFAESVKSP